MVTLEVKALPASFTLRMEGKLPACQLTYEAHVMRKRRKVRQRIASAKALESTIYRQRIKPNRKRSILERIAKSDLLHMLR
jgi:hypothetical protein